MKSYSLIIAPFLFPSVFSQISRQECESQGGQVVGDIGNGAIFRPDYLCVSNNLPPSDVVVPLPGEPIAFEGEVCCGGTGEGVASINIGSPPLGDGVESETIVDEEITAEECELSGGFLVQGTFENCNDEIIISSIERQSEGSVVCCPANDPDEGFPGDQLPNPAIERDEYTRSECLQNGGVIVGDIGDGAIFGEDYECPSSGLAPLANVIQNEEPFAIEGEVCCPTTSFSDNENDRDNITRQQCLEQGGVIVGDIGDGRTQSQDYICESNGAPPIANISPAEGEQIPVEGEVCCGPAEEDGGYSMNTHYFMAVLIPGIILHLFM